MASSRGPGRRRSGSPVSCASETAFTAVEVAGAAYLFWLGLKTLRDSRRTGDAETPRPEPRRARARTAFRQGLVSNLLNPKIAVVYTTLIPQFVVADRPALPQTASLAAVLIVLGLVWLTVYALVVARAGDVLRRPRVRVWLERVTGTALVGFGARLAVLRR